VEGAAPDTATSASATSAVRQALAHPADPRLVHRAIDTMRALGEQAYSGDYAAYDRFQRILFDLQHGTPQGDHWLRQYLASSVYDIERARMPLPNDDGSRSPDSLWRQQMWRQQEELSPLRHPMFRLLFDGDPSYDQVVTYLRQQWLILQFFWLQFVELAGQMERVGASIRDLIPLYENVWDELGEGDPEASHVVQHQRRQERLGISVATRQIPDFPETMDYINTRTRLMREAEPFGALGAIFSQEATAQSYGDRHFDMLAGVGIERRYGQVYAEHTSVDVEHADEVLHLAKRHIEHRRHQQAVLDGHRAQMTIWLAHMDRVVPLLDGSAPPPLTVPELWGRDHGRLAGQCSSPVRRPL